MEEENYENKIEKMQTKNFFICLVIVILVAVISSAITFEYVSVWMKGKNNIEILKSADMEAATNPEESSKKIADTLDVFRNVVENCYIGEIDEKNLLENTIKGYIKGLGDEYSEYMTAEEWKDYQADVLGNYVGVGIYMSMDKNDNIVVVAPIKGTPADEAGIQSGDIIAQIDNETTVGMTSSDAVSKVKGEEGTKVNLKLLRNDSEYIDVELERKNIKVYHVESELKEDGIGYIRLLTFDEGCAEEVKNSYENYFKHKNIVTNMISYKVNK